MGMFRRRVPNHYIPVHPDNVAKNDWIILLEAGTIVGPTPDRLRVARATLEKKIVKKYNVLLRPKYYLVVEGYDPRIHALYFSFTGPTPTAISSLCKAKKLEGSLQN